MNNNISPIYIPSKGRYDKLITMKTLDRMGVEYYVIVEEKEYKKNSEKINNFDMILKKII